MYLSIYFRRNYSITHGSYVFCVFFIAQDEISCFIKGANIYVFFEDTADRSALSYVLLDVAV